MKRIPILILALALSGCASISITCPDKVSTATYKGISIATGDSVSCASTANGTTASVTGTNLMAIASAVLPLVQSASASPAVPAVAGVVPAK